MKPHAKTALSLALAIVGGIAAGMHCDASEWVDNSSQTNPRPAAYTVKAYTVADPFDDRGVYESAGLWYNIPKFAKGASYDNFAKQPVFYGQIS